MAYSFSDPYNPTQSLALTWVEVFQLFQDPSETQPVDLTGLHVRAQLRVTNVPAPADAPVMEITTPGYYTSMPAWPVLEVFTVPTPTNGTINMQAFIAQYVSLITTTNSKVKLFWQILLVNKTTGDAEPIVQGKITFLPAVTK